MATETITNSQKEPSFQFDEAVKSTFLGVRNGKSIFSGKYAERWRIGDVPSGGYVVSTMLNAVRQYFHEKPQSDPVALNAFFLNKSVIAPFIIEVWDIKASKGGYALAYASIKQKKVSDSTVIASLDAYNPAEFTEERVHGIFTFGNYAKENGLTNFHEPTTPPSRSTFVPLNFMGPANLFAPLLIWKPDQSTFATDVTAGRPVLNHSIAFADGRKPDSLSLPFFADMFMPPPLLLGNEVLGGETWCPTMQIEVQFKGVPKGSDLICSFKTRNIINGRFDIDGEIWDEDGTLVATTRHQCLLVPWTRNTSLPKSKV